MVFKFLRPLIEGNFYLSFDFDIFCDIAECAGYDSTDSKISDYYENHETYLTKHDINILNRYISLEDPDWDKIKNLSNDNFDKNEFFDQYRVKCIKNDDSYGLTVCLEYA